MSIITITRHGKALIIKQNILMREQSNIIDKSLRGSNGMVAGFTTNCTISVYHH